MRQNETKDTAKEDGGSLVRFGKAVTQIGVKYAVWQRGLRILHYCHLDSNSQCWLNCQLNSEFSRPKWSPSLKFSAPHHIVNPQLLTP